MHAAVFLSAVLTLAAGPLESGQPVPLGAPGQLGTLAPAKVMNHPLGAARVFGEAQPDLFVIAGSRFYPDLVVLPWRETGPNDIPVFDAPLTAGGPAYVRPGVPAVVVEEDGVAVGYWLVEGALVRTVFNVDTMQFEETSRIAVTNLPRTPGVLGVVPRADGLAAYFGVSDGTPYSPPMEGIESSRDPRYDPYDGAGIWRGGFPYMGLYAAPVSFAQPGAAVAAELATEGLRDVRSTYRGLTAIEQGIGRLHGLVGGSQFGGLVYYGVTVSGGLGPRVPLRDPEGLLHRHPTINATPAAYPSPVAGHSDLIVGGEGALYLYRYASSCPKTGAPVYERPVPALQYRPDLYGGTLPVPNVVDWNGDGVLDLVSGNSEGRVLYLRNVGTNAAPAFLEGEPLKAGGLPIHWQPGYRGSIQGPGESRWGYTCPTVADWNGDGLPDLLLSGAMAGHVVHLNVGTRRNPELAAGVPLYLDGLELHGTWRVKPGVAPMAGRMAYVALDDQDEFHLYWQLDPYNVEDGGKLRLESGAVIGANFLKSGGTGRLKLSLVDWDGDGRTDLLVGTPRHGSVPEPDKGLPQALGLPGGAVLLLRNTGSDAAPVFAWPEGLHVEGEPVFFGQHACSPSVAAFEPGKKGLVVGVETGRFLYFAPEDISFAPLPLP